MQNPFPFELDKFQKDAIKEIDKENSVIVSAPTGAGKTVIAEYVIKKCVEEGKGVIYTAPIKALSNQKFREFSTLFPDVTGIVTGDLSINPHAPLLIMTTEIFRNRVLDKDESFRKYSWLIFDEVHYLDDVERGTVWEESLIFMPEHMRVLGLSATVPNLSQLTAWMSSIFSHPVKKIIEEGRPVPLYHHFQCRNRITADIKNLKKIAYGKKKQQFQKKEQYRQKNFKAGKHEEMQDKNKPRTLLRHLIKSERLPAIYFSFSRKRCEFLAQQASSLSLLEQNYPTEDALELFDTLTKKFEIDKAERTRDMRYLIARGVAFHHAGLHPMLKEAIEQLFTKKLVPLIFTTETFALGINMPARTVVIDEIRKRYGKGYRTLKTRDFQQMAGRAGRRGIDTEGFVYSRIDSERVQHRELSKLFSGKSEPVQSRFNLSYATLLSLYEQYGDEILDIYPRSFHYFIEHGNSNGLQFRRMKSRINLLKKSGYIKDGALTEKGNLGKRIHGHELTMTELCMSGFLNGLSVYELAALCLGLVFEPKPGANRPKLPADLRKLHIKSNNIIDKIPALEKQFNIFPLSKKIYFDLSYELVLWMKKATFPTLLELAQSDEGEIIRYFRMTLQVMRELEEAPVSSELKSKLREGIELINRDVVDAEYQLKLASSDEDEKENPEDAYIEINTNSEEF